MKKENKKITEYRFSKNVENFFYAYVYPTGGVMAYAGDGTNRAGWQTEIDMSRQMRTLVSREIKNLKNYK